MQQFKDLVTLTPWHMIFMLGNLLILTLLVKHFLFKPVQKILNERQRRADAMLADAKQAKEQAEAMQAEYEKSLAGAKEEAARLLNQASQTAARNSEEQGGRGDRAAAQEGAERGEGRDRRHGHGHRQQGGGTGDPGEGSPAADR